MGLLVVPDADKSWRSLAWVPTETINKPCNLEGAHLARSPHHRPKRPWLASCACGAVTAKASLIVYLLSFMY